jgi:crotonobetainyl-CoA:carnitine CoA-transferase CaiB-like acyl-CoA transferase
MSEALRGLRVLDLSNGPAAGLATMHLADFGADVLRIERSDAHPLDQLPAAPMWLRGKATLQLNLDDAADLARFHALAAGADVLVTSWRASTLRRRDLDFASLHSQHPHLNFCHISGFGSSGPLADLPGYEHLVAAYSGRMNLFTGIVDRPGPVFSALQVATHATAQTATAGILAALYSQGSERPGRLIETSLLQGLLPYEQGAMIGGQFEQFAKFYQVMSGGDAEPPMPSLYYHPAQAGDGRWMQFGNLLPHLFDNFLLVTELTDVLADPDFDTRQLTLPPEKHEAFRERMLERIQSRTSAEWMTECIANGGVVATTYQTTQQALDDPDIIANGHVIERSAGGRQLGPLARLTRTPASPGDDAGPDGRLEREWTDAPRPAPERDELVSQPLEGVRVVEIATIIAAPLAASFLADMGAHVTKVEPLTGDPYRGLGAGIGSARVNAGKRSLAVDLKSDSGRATVLRLIESADVLIHNFRPGVPERLGIEYEQVIEVNPSIIYLQCNGYGPDGPGALRPSTHPIPGAAMGGVLYQMGERVPEALQDIAGLRRWTRRLMRANEVNPDPNTAMVITTAATLGLATRQRTGIGQKIMVDMFGANAQANHDDFLSYPGKAVRAMPDELLHGLSPTYRLYPCAEGSWIFLALVTDRERARFVSVASEANLEPPPAEELATGTEELVTQLAAFFGERPAGEWEQLFSSAGVGCVRADGMLPSRFWLENEQARALGLTIEVEHLEWGDYRRHGPLLRFDGLEPDLKPPPLAGQHNDELLNELEG